MKKTGLILIVILLAAGVYFFASSNRGAKTPEEYRLNVTHVSDQDESQKLGKRVGGHCYLASTTMMLKSFDPAIEFWQVVVASGNATSFTYYFPKESPSIRAKLNLKYRALWDWACKTRSFGQLLWINKCVIRKSLLT